MISHVRGPLLHTWSLLAAATVFSGWLGSQNAGVVQPRINVPIALVVLLIAIAKCRLVIRNYMEVRLAPSWLQRTCDAWLLLNLILVSSLYWFNL
jgi:hypothetical protein